MLLDAALDRLRALGALLIEQGWQPELIVFTPAEIERIPGYKVALVVPIDSRASNADEGYPRSSTT